MSQELIHDQGSLSKDPYRFVLWAFPWGEDGELAKVTGPEPWQVRLLHGIRDGLLTPNQAIQLATKSGHGIGKSALVSWIILWAISTCPDTRGVVTANTENQLKTKTWVELAKWYRLFLGRELFEFSATKLCSRDPEHADTWRIDMVPWSEKNVEAFAGLHNKGRRILVVFDEASSIPDNIWETTEGALTDEDTEIIWAVFGNPTRNTGRFKECFPGGRHANVWNAHTVDSREVSFTNKKQIEIWASSYGEDSDFFRVRVKGEFPRVGAMEFISREMAEEAARRVDIEASAFDALVMGVDVARFGDDETAIQFRRGRDARSIPPVRLVKTDTMTVAGRVAELATQHAVDAIFVDGGGVGGGVIDRLRQLRFPVIEVQFGSKPDGTNLVDPSISCANKRAEIWCAMRDWLSGGTIPNDAHLIEQLAGVLYGFNANNAIQLERKEDMKKRGMASPDWADALAVTFAFPVFPVARDRAGQRKPSFADIEYNPLEAA